MNSPSCGGGGIWLARHAVITASDVPLWTQPSQHFPMIVPALSNAPHILLNAVSEDPANAVLKGAQHDSYFRPDSNPFIAQRPCQPPSSHLPHYRDYSHLPFIIPSRHLPSTSTHRSTQHTYSSDLAVVSPIVVPAATLTIDNPQRPHPPLSACRSSRRKHLQCATKC